MDEKACPAHGLVAESETTVFWCWVFWQSFTDTPDLNGNGEGENSEKESRTGRDK